MGQDVKLSVTASVPYLPACSPPRWSWPNPLKLSASSQSNALKTKRVSPWLQCLFAAIERWLGQPYFGEHGTGLTQWIQTFQLCVLLTTETRFAILSKLHTISENSPTSPNEGQRLVPAWLLVDVRLYSQRWQRVCKVPVCRNHLVVYHPVLYLAFVTPTLNKLCF